MSPAFVASRLLLVILAGLSLSVAHAIPLYASVYDPSGDQDGGIVRIEDNGTFSTFATGLDQPEGLATDSAGDLYVADGASVFKYDALGNRSTFATKVTPYSSYGLAIDAQDNVFVTGSTPDFHDVIFKYDAAGALTATWSIAGGVTGLAFGPDGSLYAAGAFSDEIGRFDANGNYSVFASFSTAYPTGYHPFGLAFDGAGNLFVSGGLDAEEVVKISADGSTITPYLSGLEFVRGLATDPAGNLYIANGDCGCGIGDNVLISATPGLTTVFATLGSERTPNFLTAAPVPEPWAVGGLGALLCAIAVVARRRRAARSL